VNIKEIIKYYGIKPKEKLGQTFLVNESVLKREVEYAEISKHDTVLEIGCGLGSLTKFLVKYAKKVYAIEKDLELIKILKNNLKAENLEIIHGDVLKIEFPKFDKVVSNIPYSISEPLIQKLLYHDFKLGVLLVSEKFSNRLIGKKKTKLSLISETFFKVKQCDLIGPENFHPKPKVYSRIVVLKPKVPNLKETIFQEFIKQRDKKVKNALREAIIKACSKFGKRVTKRAARAIVGDFKIDKKVQNLNLRELKKVESFIKFLNL